MNESNRVKNDHTMMDLYILQQPYDTNTAAINSPHGAVVTCDLTIKIYIPTVIYTIPSRIKDQDLILLGLIMLFIISKNY